MNRRQFVRLVSAAAMAAPARGFAAGGAASAPRFHLAREDERLLEELERRGCLFFAEQAGPTTGQVLDRAKWVGSTGVLDPRRMSSIAKRRWNSMSFPSSKSLSIIWGSISFRSHRKSR